MSCFLSADEMHKKTLDAAYAYYEPYILGVQKHIIDAREHGHFGVHFLANYDEYDIVAWIAEYLISLGYLVSYSYGDKTRGDETSKVVHLYTWWAKYKSIDGVKCIVVEGLL